MMKTALRTGLRAASAVALLLLAGQRAQAQGEASNFPSKPVTVVTAFSAGSGPDAVLRMVGDRLGKIWNQRVVIDNRPGGGGFVAIDLARKATPDGYTLLQLDSEHLAALPHLYRKRNFTTLDHFDPVAGLFRTPFFIAVAKDSPWRSFTDLAEAAKKANGTMSYGSWGVGSPGHLGGIMIESMTGVTMSHVPYREVGQLYSSVATGDLGFAFASLPSSQAVYKLGKLRYLAVAAPRRASQLPDVPTVSESGGPAGFDVNSFVSLVAPKGVPAAVREKVNADVRRAVAEDPEVRRQFDLFAFEPLPWSPDEIRANAEKKSALYGALIERAKIELD